MHKGHTPPAENGAINSWYLQACFRCAETSLLCFAKKKLTASFFTEEKGIMF